MRNRFPMRSSTRENQSLWASNCIGSYLDYTNRIQMVVDVYTVYTHLHESSAWSVAAECWNTCSRTNARIQPAITIITNFFANEIDSIARWHTDCLPNRQRNTHKHHEIFSMRKRHFAPLKNTIVAARWLR